MSRGRSPQPSSMKRSPALRKKDDQRVKFTEVRSTQEKGEAAPIKVPSSPEGGEGKTMEKKDPGPSPSKGATKDSEKKNWWLGRGRWSKGPWKRGGKGGKGKSWSTPKESQKSEGGQGVRVVSLGEKEKKT